MILLFDLLKNIISGKRFHSNLFVLVSLLALARLVPAFSLASGFASHKYKEHARYKRQFDASTASHLDLNITVPYIFSARLYAFGADHGDETLNGDAQPLRLQVPLYFYDKVYDTIYIHRDGVIALTSDFDQTPAVLPLSVPLIAVYWMKARGGRVHYRESTDPNILNVAQSEVNIQYRYGNDFQTRTVVLVTWEDVLSQKEPGEKNKFNTNVFQVALIVGDNACFAHFVYSRLAASTSAVAGFNGAPNGDKSPLPSHFSLPGSGTHHSSQLLEKSNIGIPGEWLFRIDEERVYLCGAGFQGLECVDSCLPTQWYLDCARQCHCADGNACNSETGECPDAKCSPGWEGSPICDTDVDECSDAETSCPNEQPDCVNTPGAYLCLCFEYDNSTNTCKGTHLEETAEAIPVPVMPLVPLLFSASTPRPTLTLPTNNRAEETNPHAQMSSRISLAPPIAAATPSIHSTSSPDSEQQQQTAFEIAPAEDENFVSSLDASTIAPEDVVPLATNSDSRRKSAATFFSERPNIQAQNQRDFSQPDSAQFVVSTLSPMTIRPILGVRPQNGAAIFSTTKGTAAVFDAQNLVTNARINAPIPVQNQQQQWEECEHCHQMAQCVKGRCACAPGWQGDGHKCEDIDECQNAGACGLHAECQNTVGSYQCVCDVGFIATINGCVDVDECAEGLVTCQDGNSSICVNTMGSYECQCRSGFIGNPESAHGCVDIDECELSSYYCGNRARCVNTAGSFICECFEGYEPASSMSKAAQGNADETVTRRCVDIDECAHASCHANATCTNTEGSFQCECFEGFIGNGVKCHETILLSVSKNAIVVSDATVPIQLNEPITVFSKQFSSLYVSPFGLVSFEQPLAGMIRSAPSDLRSASLLPLHLAYNPKTSGSVSVQQYYATNGNEQLMRISLFIQSKFRAQDFHATSLCVITFDQMHEINLEKSNTFQVILAKGVDGSTYAIFLYESMESTPRGVAGVSSTEAFVPIPTNPSLAATSNVGQAGKWIFRIDGVTTQRAIVCPAGQMGPPFCENDCLPGTWGFECENKCHCANEHPCDLHNGFCSNSRCTPGFSGFNCSVDIDECSSGEHKCHANAICQNTYGSYSCKCNGDFRGDGFNCEAIDRCLLRFGVKCAVNAHCDATSIDLPECVCDNGFHGDGRRECASDDQFEQKVDSTTTTTSTSSTTTTTSTKVKSTTTNKQKTTLQFLMDNHVEDSHKDENSSEQKLKPFIADHATTEIEDDLTRNGVIATKSASETSADSSGMLLILGPIVFCIIWLILVIVFLVICFYKRRRTRAEKYTPQMMGWSPRDYTSTRNSYFSQFTYT